jgi:hypothetical protein
MRSTEIRRTFCVCVWCRKLSVFQAKITQLISYVQKTGCSEYRFGGKEDNSASVGCRPALFKGMTKCLIESTLMYPLESQIIASRALFKFAVLSLISVPSLRFRCVIFCIVFTRHFVYFVFLRPQYRINHISVF